MATEDPVWDLLPGDSIKRTELHERFGGSGRGGISPSRKVPDVMLFSDPASGLQHGYRDRWCSDGLFDYVGQGQTGDQEFKSGNRAIRDHADSGRPLRVFEGTGDIVTYVGEFVLDSWYYADAPPSGGGTDRQVITFRLRPTDNEARDCRAGR